MRRQQIVPLVLAIGLAFGSGSAIAQTVGYNVRTGDVWVDTRLGEINDYGRRYRDPFLDEMTGYYGAPRPLLVDLLDRRRWAPADVYYACAIAHTLRLPCADIVRDYDRNPGQGWGVIAQRRGIKPGSPAFHALKRGTAASYDRWGHPVVVDRVTHVDWSQHGPGKSRAGGGVAEPAHTTPASDKGKGGFDRSRGSSDKSKGGGKGRGKRPDAA